MAAIIPDSIRFVPSRVVGLSEVMDVSVFPDRIQFHGTSSDRTFNFATIGHRQEPTLISLLKRMAFRSPFPKMVADRDWFHDPPNRFFAFYTEPRITVYMPADDDSDYATSRFFRIQQVIRSGGFETFDLG
jgi:hypothetical protein